MLASANNVVLAFLVILPRPTILAQRSCDEPGSPGLAMLQRSQRIFEAAPPIEIARLIDDDTLPSAHAPPPSAKVHDTFVNSTWESWIGQGARPDSDKNSLIQQRAESHGVRQWQELLNGGKGNDTLDGLLTLLTVLVVICGFCVCWCVVWNAAILTIQQTPWIRQSSVRRWVQV
mmetsp:Transcript_12651/g.20969  ORF Transcript_12651/g.20969 Transcript_12651/m.20969 type:complete len:175 (+) Transcript_12651:135-659(+)